MINDPSFGFNTTYDAVVIKEKDQEIKNLQKTVLELEHELRQFESNKKFLQMFDGWSEDQKNDFIEYRLKTIFKTYNRKK